MSETQEHLPPSTTTQLRHASDASNTFGSASSHPGMVRISSWQIRIQFWFEGAQWALFPWGRKSHASEPKTRNRTPERPGGQQPVRAAGVARNWRSHLQSTPIRCMCLVALACLRRGIASEQSLWWCSSWRNKGRGQQCRKRCIPTYAHAALHPSRKSLEPLQMTLLQTVSQR